MCIFSEITREFEKVQSVCLIRIIQMKKNEKCKKEKKNTSFLVYHFFLPKTELFATFSCEQILTMIDGCMMTVSTFRNYYHQESENNKKIERNCINGYAEKSFFSCQKGYYTLQNSSFQEIFCSSEKNTYSNLLEHIR